MLVLAALAGLLLLVVLLAVVIAVLGPVMATAIVAFVGGLGALVLFHYVAWGWWLGDMIRRDVEADEAAAEQTAANETAPRDPDE